MLLGTIDRHNVVLAYMPGIGSTSSATVAAGLRSSYHRLEIAFVVGICGVTPNHPDTQDEVVLGNCIVGTTMIQYDFGKQYPGHFVRKHDLSDDTLNRANPTIRALISKLQTTPNLRRSSTNLEHHLEVLLQQNIRGTEHLGCHEDLLSKDSYVHPCGNGAETCDSCDATKLVKRKRLSNKHMIQPQLHFGKYGSANTVLKSGTDRERLVKNEKIVAFEMEGAGVLESLPTILVKSACDYADSHKNKKWQRYAAATAAVGLKSILEFWRTTDTAHVSDPATKIAFNVPDHAVVHFFPRNIILKELDDWLLGTIEQERIILRGMGGAGKSQLALECCKRAISREYTSVLWIDASSIFTVHQSYKAILGLLEGSHSVSAEPKENVHRVAEILRQRQGRWLAVFDNFDSPRDFRDDPITRYIPDAKYARILFTSRDADTGRLGHTISVSGMTEDESLYLLLKRFPHDSLERGFGLRIPAELGHLALALDRAEVYIRARNLTLQDFITHFKQRKKIILQEIPHHWEYRRSKTTHAERDLLLCAFTTWELSFEQISGCTQIKQYKEHFLTLCAFFAPSSISREYFKEYCGNHDNEWTAIFKNEGSWDGFLFDDLVAECGRLSLLQVEEDNPQCQTSISFHPLIRDWLKLRKTAQQRKEISQEFVDILNSFVLKVDHYSLSWEARQMLSANIISCFVEDDSFQHADVLSTDYPSCSAHFFCGVLFAAGLYREAEQLCKQVLANRRENLGLGHPDTLVTMSDLAVVCNRNGSYDDAEKLLGQVLEHNNLEPKHPQRLQNMRDLALIYCKKGRLVDAEELCTTVLADYRKMFEPQDDRILHAMDGLAAIHLDMGNIDRAGELYRKVLAARECLGPKRLEIYAMGNLANVYWKKGRLDDAEDLFKEALISNEERLGPKHPDTLWIVSNLAAIYLRKGRNEDAEKLYKRVLAGRIERLGSKHPDTLRTLHYLADVHVHTGRYHDAERLLEQVLTGREGKLGSNHPDTLQTVQDLASLRAEMESCAHQITSKDVVRSASISEDKSQRKHQHRVSRLFRRLLQ